MEKEPVKEEIEDGVKRMMEKIAGLERVEGRVEEEEKEREAEGEQKRGVVEVKEEEEERKKLEDLEYTVSASARVGDRKLTSDTFAAQLDGRRPAPDAASAEEGAGEGEVIFDL